MATIKLPVPAGMRADQLRRLVDGIGASQMAVARVAAALEREADPPGPGTTAQIAAVEALWRHLMSRYGTYTAADLAVLRGGSRNDRSIASRLAKKNRLIALTRGRAKHYPRFEFQGASPNPDWERIVTPLTDAGWDDHDILLWLVSPHPALSGREPAELIDTAAGDVAAAAERDALGTW